MYYLDEIQMFWDLENYDENNNLLTLKEYIKSKEFGVQQDTMYLATYKEDIIMARQIIDTVGGVKFIKNYSGNYPTIPEEGTEFYKTYLPAQYLIDKFYNFDIQRSYKTIRFIEDQTISFDFSKNLSKKIKLYEGYIIFEETSPFIGTPMNLSFDQIQDYYNGCLNMNGYFTQTMVFNLKTKNIEIFDIKAHTLSWKDMLNKPIEIDLTIKVDMINDNNHKSMIDEFIIYVLERAINKV